jgi:nucleoid-associated protein YgaU
LSIPTEEAEVTPPSPDLPESPREDPIAKSQGNFTRPYLIQAGDKLSKISHIIYGNKNRWRELAKLNGLNPKDLIFAGKTIQYTPDQESLDFDSKWDALAKNSYQVKAGDTLSKLAAQHFGNGSQWSVIWFFNRETISDPNKLRVGQSLKLAGKEELAAFFASRKNTRSSH